MKRELEGVGTDCTGDPRIVERLQPTESSTCATQQCVLPMGAFDEAFDGEHNVEYWLWNGARLVPAQPDEVERLHAREAWELQEARRLNQRQSSVSLRCVDSKNGRQGLLYTLRVHATIVLSRIRSHTSGPQDQLGRRA